MYIQIDKTNNSNNANKKYIPVYHGGKKGKLQPKPPKITKDTPIISVYSGKEIGKGNIPYGTPTDATQNQPNYGKNFHVINYNYADKTFYAHGQKIN